MSTFGQGAIAAFRQQFPNGRPRTSDDPIRQLDVFAANELGIARDELSTFQQSLMDTANQSMLGADVARARAGATAAGDVAEGIFSRRTEGMGLSDRQRKAARTGIGLNRALAMSGAVGDARRRSRENSFAALRGLTSLDDAALGQQLAAYGGLANAAGQRQVREAQQKAQKKSSRNSLIGSIIGIGASLLSSEATKTAVEKKPSLLKKLSEVRIDKWRYHGGDRDHIGPYAEEFNNTFGVGKDHQNYLDVIDVLGVTLGSLKELNEKVEAIG